MGVHSYAVLEATEDLAYARRDNRTSRAGLAIVPSTDEATAVHWRIDRSGMFTELGPACRQVFGIQPEALIGKNCLNTVEPKYWPAAKAGLRVLMRGHAFEKLDQIHLDRRGRRRHIRLTARPIVDFSGWVIGAEGMAFEFSPRRIAADFEF